MYELSPVPSSLFDEYGDMRKGSKALIWRAADKSELPKLDICAFGWKLEAGIPSPEFGTTAVAPSFLHSADCCMLMQVPATMFHKQMQLSVCQTFMYHILQL